MFDNDKLHVTARPLGRGSPVHMFSRLLRRNDGNVAYARNVGKLTYARNTIL